MTEMVHSAKSQTGDEDKNSLSSLIVTLAVVGGALVVVLYPPAARVYEIVAAYF